MKQQDFITVEKSVTALEAYGTVIRLAPPLVSSQKELQWGFEWTKNVLHRLSRV